MKIWKQCTGLALSLLLLMSCMVTGAGAAFRDSERIEHSEAVEQCAELNIIGGFEDGSFRPANNVTRAEMCKMLCVLLNGGKEPTLGTNSTPTFSDVRQSYARWAEPYIEDCCRRGIVSGVGGGRFNPNGNVTFEQASKMLLVALGNSGGSYTGSNWSSAVRADARSNGFYNELSGINGSAPLSRDDAAQLIWNALQAKTVRNSSQTLLQVCYDVGSSTPTPTPTPTPNPTPAPAPTPEDDSPSWDITETSLNDLDPWSRVNVLVNKSDIESTSNYRNKYLGPIYASEEEAHITYLLDKEYSKLTGVAFVGYGAQAIDETGYYDFYDITYDWDKVAIKIYGDDKLLGEIKDFTGTSRERMFDIDLSGITFLKISFEHCIYKAFNLSTYPSLILAELSLGK